MSTNGQTAPRFNTAPGPYPDVIMVGMNSEMAKLLADFIDEIAYPDHLFKDRVATCPDCKRRLRRQKPVVESLEVTFTCACGYVEDFMEVERQIMAFRHSLRDPGGNKG